MTRAIDRRAFLRRAGTVSWVYGSPPFDEPILAWSRVLHSKGSFNLWDGNGG